MNFIKLAAVIASGLWSVAASEGADFPRLNEACRADIDCYTDFERCAGIETEEGDLEGVCEHKYVFPLTGMEYAGCLATLVVLFFSNVGGLGGGGAMIPVTIFFFGFSTKESIGVSN